MKLFAETCEALAAESSTLIKIQIISSVLSTIDDPEELKLFCLYLTGLIYPTSIQMTINVGKALVRDATVKMLEIEIADWESEFNALGEASETVAALMNNAKKSENTLFHNTTRQEATEVSLHDFKEFIESLTQNSKSTVKVQLIAEFFSKLTPLEAKYAAKLLMQKMRIGVQEATVEDSIAKAFDIEKKEVKQLNFYLGDIGDVALRCKEKRFDNIEFVLFHPIKAMLASAEVDIDEIFERMGNKVWVEYKYDGIRAHIHATLDRVEIFTRDLKRITDQFPDVCQAVRELMKLHIQLDGQKETIHSVLFDGEIVPYRDGKIQVFAEIQKRLGKKEHLEETAQKNPAKFIGYDLLYLNGEILFDSPLESRRATLEEIAGYKNQQSMFTSTRSVVDTKEEFTNFFVQSKNEGREGLMVKNPVSKYESGKRGIHWLKYKQTLDPLDVVILKAEYGEGKNAKYLSNFTFGVWDESKENLIPVGRVYSGATEEDLKYFTEYLPTIASSQENRGFLLEPKVIFEVGFENIQQSERYSSGYAVRFPRILRIRHDGRFDDKGLDEISTIDDVKRGWEKLNK